MLFILSGPSGSGKGTALAYAVAEIPELSRVVTYTTRKPRPGEQEGVDYNYLSEEEFAELQRRGEIFEATRTYGDYAYGSPSKLIKTDDPHPLIVELEVRGMLRLKASSQRRVVSIFLIPGEIEDILSRVKSRHEEKNLESRFSVAFEQMKYALSYDYILVNDDRDTFLEHFQTVVRAELLREEGKARALASKFRNV